VSELTPMEEAAVKRLRRAMKNWPDSLVLYAVDDSIWVCKLGVSSADVCETLPLKINATNMLHDAHDGSGRGAA